MNITPGIAWLRARQSLGKQARHGLCRPSALAWQRASEPSRALAANANDAPAIPAVPSVKHAHGRTWEDDYR